MNTRSIFLSVVFSLCISAGVAIGQLTSSTISGRVVDASGAVVDAVEIVATDTATGSIVRSKTDSQGNYVLLGLSPNVYRIQMLHQGFQPYTQEGLKVAVGQHLVLNGTLGVSAIAQSMTVEQGATMVNVESPMITTAIDNQMTTQLPLNGRNVLQLMQLAPDVGPTNSSSYQQSASRPDQANNFVGASGGRGGSTSYYLDGALNEDALTQIANVYPNPDAIQEFSFATSTYSAKFSGRGGGMMNAVTRGGTNQFHGTLFEFVRNSSMNAKNYFAVKQDGLKRHQFGGTIGGPVLRGKTFAFFSYQRTTIRQNPTSSATVLTAAQRNGDFSANKKQLINPATGAAFAGNQVSTSLFDPIAAKILAIVPVGDPTTGNVQYLSRLVQNSNQFVARVDQNIGDNFKVYGSYVYDSFKQPSTSIQGNLLTASTDQSWLSQFAVLNATYLFSPNLTSTVVGSLSRRANQATSPPGFQGWSDLGANVPNMVASGQTSFYLGISNYFSKNWNGRYAIPATEGGVGNQWTWVHGSHTLEFGGDVLFSKVVKDQDYRGNGYYIFGGALSGDNALDFLLGKASSFTQQAGLYFVPTRTLPALYATDNWKLTRRLTLNLGVRWNPFVPVFDSAYHEEAIFDPEAYANNIHSTLYPTLPAGLLLAGDPTVPSRVIDSNYRLFDPRVGFALDVFGDGRTSVRGGYAHYQDQMTANTINPNFSPFSTSVTFTNPASFANPYAGQVNPFPLPAGPAPNTTAFQIPMAANPMTRNMKAPTIQQWNLTVEQQLPGGMLFRTAYEGQAAHHLFGSVEGNAAVYDPKKTYQQNVADYNIRRPMGQSYQKLPLGRNVGTANFHALVASLQKQASHGLTFLAGYRWSRCMNESEAAFYDNNAYATPDPKADYGRCSYDVTNQFKGSVVWNLPTTHFAWTASNLILSNWQVNGIVTVRSGQPFNVLSGIDNSTSGIGMDRADIIGDPRLSRSRSNPEKVKKYFNTSAFTANALGTYGNTRRNFMVGPGYQNVDLSLVRMFPLKGRIVDGSSLQFRAESFNLFNRPNFSNPNATVTSSAAGTITAASDARILQLALKMSF